jgi:putative aldouronate transport system substrate-binding protein
MLNQTTRKASSLLAMLLAVAMLLSLIGCSQSTPNDNTGTPGSASNSAGNNTGDTNSGNADSGTTLPLSDKKVTLTMYAGAMDTNLAAVASDINENKFFQELERRTNVHIDFQTVPQGSTDAFNLMIAGNKLPDLIYGAYNYAEGYDAAIEDGYYLDLTPYLRGRRMARTARDGLTERFSAQGLAQ